MTKPPGLIHQFIRRCAKARRGCNPFPPDRIFPATNDMYELCDEIQEYMNGHAVHVLALAAAEAEIERLREELAAHNQRVRQSIAGPGEDPESIEPYGPQNHELR